MDELPTQILIKPFKIKGFSGVEKIKMRANLTRWVKTD